ncbi:MAG: hypothetical protein R3E86_20685 [Pseudomonadales bacterium]
MKRGIFYLMIGIPAAAVVMGAITLYLALTIPDPSVRHSEAPLSKTSWQERQ